MAITSTTADEIALDGVYFPLSSPLRVTNLAVFPRKVTIGDASKDSDELLSTKVWSDFTGGLGVLEEQEGVDNNRFYTANLDTRYPNKLARNPLITTAAMSASGCRPLGDYDGIAPGTVKFYAAGGTQLSSFDGSFTRTDHGALTDVPVNKGVVFKGTGATKLLFIPQGDQGYQTWDGAAIAAQSTNALPIAFCEWDGKLFSLGSNGVLSENTDGSTTWTTKATLDASLTPRGLVAYFNRADEPTLHVITDRDVWAYDASIPKLYRTHLQYPPHAHQGLASCEWRGDLYVSVGVGVHRYTGATISAMGPDNRDGLPYAYRGKITDLVPEYNGILAVVQSASGSSTSILQWTGIGWHFLANATATTTGATWGMMTLVGDGYHFVWGESGSTDLNRIQLRKTFYNPQDGAVQGVDSFATSGTSAFLTTAYFDAGMKGFTKAASHLTVNVERMPANAEIVFSYAKDFSGDAVLGTVTTSGATVLPFGTNSAGITFDRINITATFDRDSSSDTQVVDSFILHYMKIPHEAFSWTASIVLPDEGGYRGKSSEELATKLDELLVATDPPFVTMVHRDNSYRVRVAQVTGDDKTGQNFGGTRNVSIVQIPSS